MANTNIIKFKSDLAIALEKHIENQDNHNVLIFINGYTHGEINNILSGEIDELPVGKLFTLCKKLDLKLKLD